MENVKPKSSGSIEHIRELLNHGRAHEALKFIDHLGQKTPVMENARGVCLLRLGRFEDAVKILREVAFQGSICMPTDTPVQYQINFATAMMLCNLKDGAIPILKKLDAAKYSEAAQLKDAVSRWVKSLGFIERCCCRIGLYPRKAVPIDFPPGII